MRKQIKNIIINNNILFNLYYRFLYKPKSNLDLFLNKYSQNKKGKLRFIQIGANDGQWNDPIYKFIRRDRWEGILIEPQKDIFEKLVKNYKYFPKLIFENVAIGEQTGSKSLYRISFTNAKWASGLSSFNIEDVQRMIDAGYVERMALQDNIIPPTKKDKWIKTEEVKTLCFFDLVKKYKYENIDLLMIDVEGYEFEILKTIPFHAVKIDVIIYEHTHFNEDIKNTIHNYLVNNNFEISMAESDTIAIRK